MKGVQRNIWIILSIIFLLAITIEVSRSNLLFDQTTTHHLVKPYEPENTIDALNANEKALFPHKKYAVIYDPDNEFSMKVQENVSKILDYMNKEHTLIPLEEVKRLDESIYSAIIVTSPDVLSYWSSSKINQYARQGGYVIFTMMPALDAMFPTFYRNMGIYEYGDYVETPGIYFHKNVLIGYEGKEFKVIQHSIDFNESEPFIDNSALHVSLESDVDVWASSSEGIPLIWKHPEGEGAITVINGQMLQNKASRGLFTGILSMTEPDFIYPVMNMKIVYIDDFPAPIPKGSEQEIREEYRRSVSRFIKDIWWPDMIALSYKYDFKYTTVFIQSYNNKVSPPFDNPVDENPTNMITYGREVLKHGGELGLHGYNHQSLTLDENSAKYYYQLPWINAEDMAESVRTAENYFHRIFTNYQLMTYVPPSNVLDNTGRQALIEALPNLQNIASVYNEDDAMVSYVQEFEIADDGIIELPRITSGFLFNEFQEWSMANALTSLGVFSHFVHPDDVLDIHRSQGNSWSVLHDHFDKMFTVLKEGYPWLKAYTSSEAASQMEKYLRTEMFIKQDEESIKVYFNNYSPGTEISFILRTDKKISKEKNCTVQKIDSGTYLVTTDNKSMEIGLVKDL